MHANCAQKTTKSRAHGLRLGYEEEELIKQLERRKPGRAAAALELVSRTRHAARSGRRS